MGEACHVTNADVVRIHDRIDGMDSKLDKVVEAVAGMKATSERCTVMLDSHERILRGNGRKGLEERQTSSEERVAAIENVITGHIEDSKTLTNQGKSGIGPKGIALIVTAVLAGVASILTGIAKVFFGV